MRILGVIPARFQSSRLPGKPLVLILGKPLIIWVCEIVEKALGNENTIVATDDERIAKTVQDYGFKFVMTSSKHLTGTDRLAEVSRKIDADIYVNVQGDEPLVNHLDIKKIAKLKLESPETIINAMTYISDDEEPNSVHIPKVIVNLNNELLYLSRLSIPGSKMGNNDFKYLKQVCIYAFSKQELEVFFRHPLKTPLEQQEDIEILRFLELGYTIKMVHLDTSSLAVDVPEDIKKVENALQSKNL
mgnify:CR=1 FL=1